MSLLVLFLLISSSTISATNCLGGTRNISKEEADDIEIEGQLRILNKKPVKTIIMNPSSIPGETRTKNVLASSIFHGLQRERCPSGTVPIRRTTREDLVNTKYFVKTAGLKGANGYPNTVYHYVFAEEVISGKKYFGAAASMTIHNLTLDLDQFSTSQIWIVNSSPEETNGIEFGIMKYPGVAGDSLPRLFGYWASTDGHNPTGCYNMLCPGFVQVSKDVFLNNQFTHSSTYGEKVYEAYLAVYRAQDTGHWWLRVGPNADVTEDVGYWPNELFTTLKTSAVSVRYGGFVGSLSQESKPPMGNGYFPQLNDHRKTAFMRLLRYANETGNLVDVDSRSVKTTSTAKLECYSIIYARQIERWENHMVYGGPGGMCH
ncbi:hypothetical protein C5167_035623 [Papaver somniferum]|uniref:Neprosin PEP catalytic domain-containing protein n=1 Tax=Papaver somniferum TaxID=3469 RepID=A0A4Y7KK23_PAPSO|nr:hypothetical protein C5167_035623 [Papaver somniferum]